MGQAIDYSGCDWVHGNHHNDGDGLGRFFRLADIRYGSCNKNINLELYQFGDETWDALLVTFSRAILDDDIFALDISEISQSLPKRLDVTPGIGSAAGC
jgi:hypothetical protein